MGCHHRHLAPSAEWLLTNRAERWMRTVIESVVKAKDEERQRFALWAITKIAQRVKGTVMAYDAL